MVWSRIVTAIAASVALASVSCNQSTQNEAGADNTRSVIVPATAIVSSVDVLSGEIREGMRKVRATLMVDQEDGASSEIVITEWVPVVLLGRLTVGNAVKLIHDPTQNGRLTLGL